MRKSQSDPLRQDRVQVSMHVSAQPRVVEVLDNTRSVCEKEAQDDDKAHDLNSRTLMEKCSVSVGNGFFLYIHSCHMRPCKLRI